LYPVGVRLPILFSNTSSIIGSSGYRPPV